MRLAGSKGSGFANKYKNQGLRVIAVDVDGTQLALSEGKWKDEGADYYLYHDDGMICFKKLYGHIGAFPTSKFIKEWSVVREWKGAPKPEDAEKDLKSTFSFQ